MQIGETWGSETGRTFGGVTPHSLGLLRTHQREFANLTWYYGVTLGWRAVDFTEQANGVWVAPNFFRFLGATPSHGRGFVEADTIKFNSDGESTGGTVVVLSHSFWMKVFSGDPAAIGKNLRLSNSDYAIVGVMPEQFDFPWGGIDFWIPADDPPDVPANDGNAPNIRVLVRLKEEIAINESKAALLALANSLRKTSSFARTMQDHDWTLMMQPLRDQFLDKKLRSTHFALTGAIIFTLIIACANVASLLLTRTEHRQTEWSIRSALGASRRQLLRQQLIETFLLAGAGCVAGLFVAHWGIELLAGLLPSTTPRLAKIGLNSGTLAICVLTSLFVALIFSVLTTFRITHFSPTGMMPASQVHLTGDSHWRRFHSALVTSQTAFALVLLTGAGLMVQSVRHLLAVNPGVDREKIFRVHVHPPASSSSFLDDVRQQLADLPGVEAVGLGKDDWFAWKYKLEGRPRIFRLYSHRCGIDEADLFAAMGIRVLKGRTFNRGDAVSESGSVLINQTMAQLCWPGQDALGKRFHAPGTTIDKAYHVVGIVADSRPDELTQAVTPRFYRPFSWDDDEGSGFPPEFIVRTSSNAETIVPLIHQVLKAAGPGMGAPRIGNVKQDLFNSTEGHRTYMKYLLILAGVGVFLTALGIFSVVTQSVVRRTREIGIRMALGADRSRITQMVVTEGLVPAGFGVAIGFIGAWWLTQFLESRLFGVSPRETSVFFAAVIFLLAVGVTASFLPARRSAALHPIDALRHQ